MKLVLKDGSQIELTMGNNQNQFVVPYSDATEMAEIEAKLTEDNLSDAHYEINGIVTDTLKNKVVSGSNRNIITKKVTYYLTDANSAEIKRLEATVTEQAETITSMQETIDTLVLMTFEPTRTTEEEPTPTESEVSEDVSNS